MWGAILTLRSAASRPANPKSVLVCRGLAVAVFRCCATRVRPLVEVASCGRGRFHGMTLFRLWRCPVPLVGVRPVGVVVSWCELVSVWCCPGVVVGRCASCGRDRFSGELFRGGSARAVVARVWCFPSGYRVCFLGCGDLSCPQEADPEKERISGIGAEIGGLVIMVVGCWGDGGEVVLLLEASAGREWEAVLVSGSDGAVSGSDHC